MSTLAPSGLSAVDDRWGGLRVGGAYLLVGRADVGRAGLALQIARAAVDGGGRCLIISPRAPEALAADGRSVGLDLGEAHRTGRLRMLRTPDAATLAAGGSAGLAKAYQDLGALVEGDRPDRVVIEDLTPLVQFDSFEALTDAFSGLVETLERVEATLVVGLGEPANDASAHLLQLVGEHVDGTIRLHSENGQRRLVLYRHREPETGPVEPLAAASAAPTVEMAHAPSEFAPLPAEDAPQADAPQADAPQADTSEADVEAPPPTDPAAEAPEPPATPPMAAPPTATPPMVAPPSPDAAPDEPAPAAGQTAMPPPAAPQPVAPQPVSPPPAAAATPAFEAPSGDGAPPRTATVPPPPAEAALMQPTDGFAVDPAARFLKQGYMIDSAHPGTTTAAPTAPPTAAPAAPVAPFPAALADAFASRAAGGHFLIVAVRMEPTAAEAAHFATVADGLRRSLRPTDLIQVDDAALRAAVLLPDASPEASKALFAGLQSHLRATLGDAAQSALRAVGAVSIPDGQPFGSADELMQYVFQG